MSKQRQRGNALERYIARRLGGRRVEHYGGEDVAHEWLSIECKERQGIPQWLTQAVAQALAYAGQGKLAIAVLHELNRSHDEDLVVMRLKDFEEWFNGSPQTTE